MQLQSIRSIRQSELSRAAFEAVVRYGLRGTTLERVGEIAGVSKGVVLHHFKDKDLLLEAVFRRSNAMLSGTLVELYRHAESPNERLWAIVLANFDSTIFNQQVCQAWVSLLAEVPHSAMCQRVQHACNNRITSNLRRELRHLTSPEDAHRIAELLGVLIDGVWVRAGMSPKSIDSQLAIDEFEYAITLMLNCTATEIEKHQAARQKIQTISDLVLKSRAFKLQEI